MSGLKFDASNLLNGLAELDQKVIMATKLYGNAAGEKMVSDAKKNAPWIDRTGLSRQTIDKSVSNGINSITIELRGNTPHFKYLELCHEKKNAILWPTIQKFQGEILNGWIKVIQR